MLELMDLSKQINGLARLTDARALKLLCWLDTHPIEHRLVVRDMRDTLALVGMFFPDITGLPEKAERQFIDIICEWRRRIQTKHKVFDNEWKAAQKSYIRHWFSAPLMPLEWFDQAGKLAGDRKIWKESDAVVRPQIAKLVRTLESIIRSIKRKADLHLRAIVQSWHYCPIP